MTTSPAKSEAEWEIEITDLFRRGGMARPGLEARHLVRAARGQTDQIPHWARERLTGRPLAYITGRKGFYKHEFSVAEGVLIPRPETEHVVEVALQRASGREIGQLADLGCGSGCLGLSVLADLPNPLARLSAVDLSAKACALTAENAQRMGLADRVTVVTSDVRQWAPHVLLDLIVANPPYIAPEDPAVEADVHRFEPHLALYAPPDGLSAFRDWSQWAADHLAPGGILVFEIGAGQSACVCETMRTSGYQDIRMVQDLAGFDRVVSAVQPEKGK